MPSIHSFPLTTRPSHSINAEFQVNSDGSGAQPLNGDSTLQRCPGSVAFSGVGLGGWNRQRCEFRQFGINTNNDGTLTVDSGALSTALTSNFSGFQSFLQTATTGFAANLNTVLNNVAGPGGSLPLDAQGYQTTASDLSQQISDLQAALAVRNAEPHGHLFPSQYNTGRIAPFAGPSDPTTGDHRISNPPELSYQRIAVQGASPIGEIIAL